MTEGQNQGFSTDAPAAELPSVPPISRINTETVVCCAAAIGLVTAFNLLFLFRFVPLSEGWFSVYASLITRGKVLYRDIYFFLPPLYPWLIAGITRLFGYKLIILRYFGLGVILTMTVTLFGIIRRFVSPAVAMFSTVIAIIYYQSGNAHITYDFIQVMNAAALLGCLCIIKVAEPSPRSGGGMSVSTKWAALAGFFGAIAFFTKQSNGAFIVMSSFLAVGIAERMRTGSWRWAAFLWYAFGFTIVAAMLTIGLLGTGSLRAASRMLTGGAAAAKGGLGTALFAFFVNTFDLSFVSRVLSLCVIGAALGYFSKRWMYSDTHANGRRPIQQWFLPLVAGIVGAGSAIYVPWYRVGGVPGWVVNSLSNDVTLSMMPFAVAGTCVLLVATILSGLPRRGGFGLLLIPGLISAGMLWGNGTSGGLSEAGAFLGFAISFALLLNHGGWARIGAVVLAVVCGMQTAIFAEVKYRVPYAWWGLQASDARLDLVPASQPLLRGLYLTKAENKIFNDITHIIETETNPGDHILVFPQTPIFYLMGNRELTGRAVVHWFDFLPDDLARKEADLLLADPPALIIMLDMPETVWRAHEMLFRAGRPSGQREIVKDVAALEASGMYADVATIGISSGYNYRIWKRK